MLSGSPGIRWNPRVRQEKIRRLYTMDARGLIDDVLVEDVGIALLLRCQSLLMVDAAQVVCPACGLVFATGWQWTKRHEAMTIRCPGCQGWECTGRQYRESFCRDALAAGNAVAFFSEFVQKYPRATTARERLLLIDRLIHQFHHALKWNPDAGRFDGRHEFPHAINGNNLIEGTHDEVLAFLDGLTYDENVPAELAATKAQWQANVAAMRRTRRPGS